MACKDCQDKEKFIESFNDGIPYIDDIYPDKVLRTFPEDTPEHLLKWHFDEEDRDVYVLGDTDWLFQFDNELPKPFGTKTHIPKGVYHRVIKGTGELQLVIYKDIK